jgi:hypothetical protein
MLRREQGGFLGGQWLPGAPPPAEYEMMPLRSKMLGAVVAPPQSSLPPKFVITAFNPRTRQRTQLD